MMDFMVVEVQVPLIMVTKAVEASGVAQVRVVLAAHKPEAAEVV
jgi:hypothetical protein